jgi:4-amino-4-deoxy-L-arabinose transferase-like glycosyltransferase
MQFQPVLSRIWLQLSSPNVVRLLTLAALVGYGVFIVRHTGGYAGGSDSSGYMNQARLFSTGSMQLPVRAIDGAPPHSGAPYLYVPLGFAPVPGDPSTMGPTYPTGLSLVIWLLAGLVGWRIAPDLTIVLHTVGGVLLVYALARALTLSRFSAFLSAAVVGLSPLYIFMGVQPMSDVPALVWVTVAILTAERSRRKGWAWAAAAGGAFALAVLMRPTNLIVLGAVAVALGLSWRRWLVFGLAGLPGAAFQLWYSNSAYGKWFLTGYGDVRSLFRSDLFAPTVQHYAEWLPILFTPLIVLAVALPLLARSHGRTVALLALWFLPILGCYSLYEFTHHTWWFLRFILPAAPALAIASVFVATQLSARVHSNWVRHPISLSAILIAALLFLHTWNKKLHTHSVAAGEEIYPVAASWARENLPPEAVILAMQLSGTLLYYTDFTFVRWDQAPRDDIERVTAACAAAGRPLYALLFPGETEPDGALERWQADRWTQVASVRHVSVWQYQPPSRIPE